MSHSNSMRSSDNVLYLCHRAPRADGARISSALRDRLIRFAAGAGLALALAAVALAAPTPAVAHGQDIPAVQAEQ